MDQLDGLSKKKEAKSVMKYPSPPIHWVTSLLSVHLNTRHIPSSIKLSFLQALPASRNSSFLESSPGTNLEIIKSACSSESSNICNNCCLNFIFLMLSVEFDVSFHKYRQY